VGRTLPSTTSGQALSVAFDVDVDLDLAFEVDLALVFAAPTEMRVEKKELAVREKRGRPDFGWAERTANPAGFSR